MNLKVILKKFTKIPIPILIQNHKNNKPGMTVQRMIWYVNMRKLDTLI